MRSSLPRRPFCPSLAVEFLELRTLPTTYTVDTLVDESDGDFSAGDLSLREAIELSNGSAPLDKIGFDASLDGGTIVLGGTELLVTQAVTIDAMSLDSLTVDAANASRGLRLTGGGEVILRGLTITNGNAGSGDGGGIYAESASLKLESGTVSNSTGRLGGGVATAGSGNHDISNSAIIGNHATIHGGGVLHNGSTSSGGSLFVINTTIAENSADVSGGGIGHYAGNFGITFSTIVNNTADADGNGSGFGGGLATNQRRQVTQSIIAGNLNQDSGTTHPDDIGGQGVTIAQSWYNVIGDPATAGSASTVGNRIGADGDGNGFLPLEDILDPIIGLHGGRTLNYLPQAGGFAIDINLYIPSAVEFDQRGPGFARQDGVGLRPKPDAGAIELPFTAPLTNADIIGRSSTGRLLVGSSDGSKFTTTQAGVVDPSVDWDDFTAVDMNLDGRTDLIGFSNTQGRVIRLFMNENGQFNAPSLASAEFDTSQTWVDMLIGEFDGNLGLDVALRSQETGQWIIDPYSGFSYRPATWSANVDWQQVLVGDFNNDGLDDIAGRASTGTWIVSESNGGSAPFTTRVWGGWSPNVSWEGVSVGDVNNDGFADIVGRASSGTIVAALSDGTRFNSQVFGGLSPGGGYTDLMLGDFNGDGNSDLFARSASGKIVVGLSDTTKFNFSQFAAISATAGFTDMQIADFNADGLSDFATRSASGKWVVGLSDGTAFSTSLWATWSNAVTYDNVTSGEFVVV